MLFNNKAEIYYPRVRLIHEDDSFEQPKSSIDEQMHKDDVYRHSCSVCRVSALWPGGCGLDPRPSHTKD